MNSYIVIFLYLIWFGFWEFYNAYLLKKNYTTEGTPQILVPVYCIFSFTLLVISRTFSTFNLLLLIFSLFLGLYLKNRFSGRLSNSIFQMTWLSALATAITSPTLIMIATLFFVVHLPIFYVSHLKTEGKLIILLCSFIGGYILASEFIFLPTPYNLIAMITTHLISYELIIRPFDFKYKLGIIN